jgi:ligand-binding sensor domain-containing protein
MKKSTFPVIILSGILILSACREKEAECIEPETTFSFPYRAAIPDDYEREEVLPLGDWKEIVQFSDTEIGAMSLVIRNGNEIWGVLTDQVFRYNIESEELSIYHSIGGSAVIPQALFADSQGVVWGIDTNHSGYPLVSRFMEETNHFEFVDTNLCNSGGRLYNRENIVEDPTGIIWMFLGDDNNIKEITWGLYGFDPETISFEYEFLPPEGGNFYSMAIDSERVLWIGGDTLYEFYPETGELIAWSDSRVAKKFPNGEIVGGRRLFFDHEGKLWFGDEGWLDFSGPYDSVFYQLIQSPIFLDSIDAAGLQYVWQNAVVSHEDSKGMYWFYSGSGTAYLDFENEEWCLFTTGQSNVIEDNDNDLWIAVFGKLYRLVVH